MRYLIIAALLLLPTVEVEARTTVYFVTKMGRTTIITGGGRTCYVKRHFAGMVTRSCY